jgi:hypothetical protein
MYENRHGRFTAVDPLLASGKSANPQTFNRYVYVMNNPLVLKDPSGLQAATPSGRWYQPVVPDGSKKYRYESTQPNGYEPVTETNKANELIGDYFLTQRDELGRPDFVIKFNPMGPREPLPTIDLRNGQRGFENLTHFERSGWDYAMGDGYQSLHPATGAVQDVSMETVFVAQGVFGLARAGVSAGVARSFATAESEAIIYGGGNGAAKTWATIAAENTGRQTIEMTPGGRILNSITNAGGEFSIRHTFRPLNNRIWNWASGQYARGISDEVQMFRALPLRPGNALENIELPILQSNPNVFIRAHQVPYHVPR